MHKQPNRLSSWFGKALCVLTLGALLTGCVLPPAKRSVNDVGLNTRAVELTEVPFYAQKEFHCGPASLAAVLEAAGAEASPGELAREIFIPGRQGSMQVEVVAAARRHGVIAYPIAKRLDALYREVTAGRPVLVLQDLALAGASIWHYAIVIGFDRNTNEVILRSGSQRRLVMNRRAFERSWRRGDHWAVVMLKPGSLPAEVEEQRYVAAVAPLERVGQWEAAAKGWSAALELWPMNLTALIGMANVHANDGDIRRAIDTLENAVQWNANSGEAHNNLAYLLSHEGYHHRAIRHATLAVSLGGPHVEAFRDTLREAQRKAQDAANR